MVSALPCSWRLGPCRSRPPGIASAIWQTGSIGGWASAFTLGYFHSFYPPYGVSPEQAQQKHREWQDKLRASWRQNEQQWMVHALPARSSTWGSSNSLPSRGQKARTQPSSACQTWGGQRRTTSSAPRRATGAAVVVEQRTAEASRCWVVQPNFDIIVYLDRASATRLTFIERIADAAPRKGPRRCTTSRVTPSMRRSKPA